MNAQRANPLVPPKGFQAPRPSMENYYGHEELAKTCAHFITHLFACPETPPGPVTQQNQLAARLPYFIAYALHRTKLDTSVTFSALVLLQRLKARFPTARGSSGHRLFLSAYMISSKVICDDCYSNKSWTIVGQGMFNLREINQMEREMCNYLEWSLNVAGDVLGTFTAMVKRDFAGPGPYPAYLAEHVSKRKPIGVPAASAALVPMPKTSTSPIPVFGQDKASNTDAAAAAAASSNVPLTQTKPSKRKAVNAPLYTPPLDTPPQTRSSSASPASSGSPVTPTEAYDSRPSIAGTEPVAFRKLANHASRATERGGRHHPLKVKMFCQAAPSKW